MVHRLILLANGLIFSSFAVAAQASTQSISLEELSPLVFPSSDGSVIPQSQPDGLDQQIIPGLDFSLPSSDEGDRQPQYNEQPVKPEPPPIRLEIKLSKRRVTVYRGTKVIKSYPIAVGRPGWETPKGTYQVKQMFRNPTWIHPLKQGISIAGGDPENPLGRYWIGFWTNGRNWIGFHGTPNPNSVGTAASHGCIRMYNQDIEELFQKVSLGTEVRVIQ